MFLCAREREKRWIDTYIGDGGKAGVAVWRKSLVLGHFRNQTIRDEEWVWWQTAGFRLDRALVSGGEQESFEKESLLLVVESVFVVDREMKCSRVVERNEARAERADMNLYNFVKGLAVSIKINNVEICDVCS